jgi:hypothetical protein
MVCIVLKVGKLVACWEDSWFCGGGGMLGSALGWIGLFESLRWGTLFATVAEGK